MFLVEVSKFFMFNRGEIVMLEEMGYGIWCLVNSCVWYERIGCEYMW